MTEIRSAHLFAGIGGDIVGLSRVEGFRPTFAVEINKYRCKVLRQHVGLKVYQGAIEEMTLSDYPSGSIPFFFLTFPCQKYTNGADLSGTRTGDHLYLEALREIVMRYPEVIVLENVWGIRKFKRVMETFRALPHYYCTELGLCGSQFSIMRKKRVFLVLHRQPFDFSPILDVPPRIEYPLSWYLEENPTIYMSEYVHARVRGEYRDLPNMYAPGRTAPIALPINYADDYSTHLVYDGKAPDGYRSFTPLELLRLHGFDDDYLLPGSRTQQVKGIVDSVMPPVAAHIGHTVKRYFDSLGSLAIAPKALGHRDLTPPEKEQELTLALDIVKSAKQAQLI